MRATWLAIAILLNSAAVTAEPAPATRPIASPFEEHRLPTKPENANDAYRLLRPVAAEAGKQYPLVVYLHGAGSKGDDNAKPMGEVPPKLLATPALRERFPCFVLVPQCKAGTKPSGRPNNWVNWIDMEKNPSPLWVKSEPGLSDQLQGAAACLDDVMKREPVVDPKRVYLVGVSMGGSGSWNWSSQEPERFAAMVTVCALNESSRAEPLAKARLPIWVFHGEKDEQVPVDRSRTMVAALKAAGHGVRYTEYEGAGHGIATRVFTENENEVFTWLFGQVKP